MMGGDEIQENFGAERNVIHIFGKRRAKVSQATWALDPNRARMTHRYSSLSFVA
jgi:hypothetical protein